MHLVFNVVKSRKFLCLYIFARNVIRFWMIIIVDFFLNKASDIQFEYL